MLVPTREYCTVFSALFAVTRASKLRVDPIVTVLDSDPLIDTVPGCSIEFRDALPYVPSAGALNAAVLNQLFSEPAPATGCPGTRFGRSELPAPDAISAAVPEYCGVAKVPEAKV